MAAAKREIRQIMSSPAVTGNVSETLAVAAGRMREKKVGSVVVVEDGSPIGILTERDLLRAAAAGVDSTVAKTAEWMTESPDVVARDLGVHEAFRMLMDRG